METVGFELWLICTKTGKETKIVGPYKNRTLIEEEETMYGRHLLPLTSLSIRTRNIKLHPMKSHEKISFDTKKHNPFNSDFKPPTKTIIIPKDPTDARDLPWKLILNSSQEEKDWVESIRNIASISCYKNNLDIKLTSDLVGSLWWRGYVNALFDYNHCSYKNIVWQWMGLIGNNFDPVVITNLKGADIGSGIYVNGFFTDDVTRLCEYCHKLFGKDKYEVATLFIKRNLTDFNCQEPDIVNRAYNLTQVAAIYAEDGNIESARKYYQESICLLEGKDWQCNYIDTYNKFEEYVKLHGTSILSSYF